MGRSGKSAVNSRQVFCSSRQNVCSSAWNIRSKGRNLHSSLWNRADVAINNVSYRGQTGSVCETFSFQHLNQPARDIIAPRSMGILVLEIFLARFLQLFLELRLCTYPGKGDTASQSAHVHIALIMESDYDAALSNVISYLHDFRRMLRVDTRQGESHKPGSVSVA